MFGFEMQLLGQGRSLSPTGLKILARRLPGLPTNAMQSTVAQSIFFRPFSPSGQRVGVLPLPRAALRDVPSLRCALG